MKTEQNTYTHKVVSPVTDVVLVDGKWIDPASRDTDISAPKSKVGVLTGEEALRHRKEIDRMVHEAGIAAIMNRPKRDIFREYRELYAS